MQQPCLLFSLRKVSVLGNMTSHILQQPQTSVSIIDTFPVVMSTSIFFVVFDVPFEAAVV